MPTVQRALRSSAKFQDFDVLEKMARGGMGKDLNAYVTGAFGPATIERVPEAEAALTTRLAYALSLAEDVFADRKQAVAFLRQHHPQLGATPLAKLQTEWGGREVERLLQSVIHGLPA